MFCFFPPSFSYSLEVDDQVILFWIVYNDDSIIERNKKTLKFCIKSKITMGWASSWEATKKNIWNPKWLNAPMPVWVVIMYIWYSLLCIFNAAICWNLKALNSKMNFQVCKSVSETEFSFAYNGNNIATLFNFPCYTSF